MPTHLQIYLKGTWSIHQTPSGLFFADFYSRDGLIYHISSLSKTSCQYGVLFWSYVEIWNFCEQPDLHLIVPSQQLKTKNELWNLFKTSDIVLISLLLNLNRFLLLSFGLHCWLWTSKYWLKYLWFRLGTRFKSFILQTHRVYFMVKRRGNDRLIATSGVFVGWPLKRFQFWKSYSKKRIFKESGNHEI